MKLIVKQTKNGKFTGDIDIFDDVYSVKYRRKNGEVYFYDEFENMICVELDTKVFALNSTESQLLNDDEGTIVLCGTICIVYDAEDGDFDDDDYNDRLKEAIEKDDEDATAKILSLIKKSRTEGKKE